MITKVWALFCRVSPVALLLLARIADAGRRTTLNPGNPIQAAAAVAAVLFTVLVVATTPSMANVAPPTLSPSIVGRNALVAPIITASVDLGTPPLKRPTLQFQDLTTGKWKTLCRLNDRGRQGDLLAKDGTASCLIRLVDLGDSIEVALARNPARVRARGHAPSPIELRVAAVSVDRLPVVSDIATPATWSATASADGVVLMFPPDIEGLGGAADPTASNGVTLFPFEIAPGVDLNAFAVVVLDNPAGVQPEDLLDPADVGAYESINFAARRALLFVGPATEQTGETLPDLIVAEGTKIAMLHTAQDSVLTDAGFTTPEALHDLLYQMAGSLVESMLLLVEIRERPKFTPPSSV